MEQKKIDKHEFTKMVHDKVRGIVSAEDTYWTVKAVFECMADILEEGDSLYIREYFTLYPRLKKGRTVNNFGNPMVSPEHYVPCFKPQKILKDVCKELDVDKMEEESDEDEE